MEKGLSLTPICWLIGHPKANFKEASTKGQLVSKCFLGSSISSKKWTNEFDFTTMIPQVDLFSFVFWRKSTTQKNHFEINWPLKEVDFSGSIGSSMDTIRHLVNNITTNLEKINLARVERIGDDDVHILAQRFYELETLNELQMITYCVMRKSFVIMLKIS